MIAHCPKCKHRLTIHTLRSNMRNRTVDVRVVCTICPFNEERDMLIRDMQILDYIIKQEEEQIMKEPVDFTKSLEELGAEGQLTEANGQIHYVDSQSAPVCVEGETDGWDK